MIRYLFSRACIASLAAVTALCAIACSDDSRIASAGELSAGTTSDLTGAEEGELVTYVADFEDGHSERWHALRRSDGREMRLTFDEPPTVPAGTRLRVHGDALADGLHVTAYEAAPAGTDTAPPAGTDTTPPNGTFAAPAEDTYALVLVDLGSGVNVTADQAQTTMFSTNPADKSFASFYYESSYGKYSISGDVIGPYTYSMTTCDTTGMYKAIEPQITKAYNHLIYYFTKSSLCSWGGLGEEGSVTRPAKRTWMNGSLGCVVLMQEPGHNLGLMHANTIKCGTSSFSTTPGTSCTITEYGNTMTPMGSGCHQLNAYEKWYEQWLTGCNGVRVTSTGSFNLVPLGDSCPGAIQVLQVPFPAPLTVSDPQSTNTTVNLKDYYVELRAAAGTFDQYASGGRGGGVPYTQPTVLVYASDDVHAPTTTTRGGGGSVWTELLNMNPTSNTFAGLTMPGQSFSDPAGGATITLQSISATGAIINVDVPNGTGAPTCIDGTTLVGSGSSCDGTAVTIPPFDGGSSVPPRDAGAAAEAGSRRDGGSSATTGSDAGRAPGTGGQTGTTGSSGTTAGVDTSAGGPALGGITGGTAGAQTTTGEGAVTGGGATNDTASSNTVGGASAGATNDGATASDSPQDSGTVTGNCGCKIVGASRGAQPGAAAAGLLALTLIRLGRGARRPRPRRRGARGRRTAPIACRIDA